MKLIRTRSLDLDLTDKLCAVVANHVQSGDVIALSGELGSGKTTFVAHVAQHLDLSENQEVTSPTYVIHHIYEAKLPIHHIDLYRLESFVQIENLGFEEFMGEKGVTLIEWFEKFPQIWTGEYLNVEIEIIDLDHRIYSFSVEGENSERWNALFEDIQSHFCL